MDKIPFTLILEGNAFLEGQQHDVYKGVQLASMHAGYLPSDNVILKHNEIHIPLVLNGSKIE